MDNLLHLLHAAQVAQHVADRNDILVLDEICGDLLDLVDWRRRHGLLDKVADCGEILDEIELEVSALADATAECGRRADDDSAGVSRCVRNGCTRVGADLASRVASGEVTDLEAIKAILVTTW